MRIRRQITKFVLFSAVLILAAPAFAQSPFVGEIDLVGFSFAPPGWHECDGSLLPISEYTALFSLIGTTFGGDGINTFAVPDLRGRRAIGSGQGPGLGFYSLGQVGGEETVTLTVAQMPAHAHTFSASMAPGTAVGPTNRYWASASQVNLYSTSAGSLTSMAATALGSSGSGLPHDNMPPYLVLNYIIALEGIFPAQN